MDGAASERGLLTVGPRLTGVPQGSWVVFLFVTQRSDSPELPGRADSDWNGCPEKYSYRPSVEMHGACSSAGLLTVGPRLTGAPQGAVLASRVVTHRSWPPCPPGRSELK